MENLGYQEENLKNACMVSAYRISGRCVYDGVHDGESFTWLDLCKILFLQNKEEFFLVKFITTSGAMVPRADYQLPVTRPIPIEPITSEPEEPELKKRRML